jgi:hypothetical protein
MIADSINSIYTSVIHFPISQKGIDVTEYVINTDLLGVPRAMNPSIGCFEFPLNNNIFNINKDDINFLQNNETGLIMVENKTKEIIKQFAIFDLSGKKIYELKMNEPRFFMINIKGILPKGVYLLSVERNTSYFSHKFIVSSN